jgi:hypothetical protein
MSLSPMDEQYNHGNNSGTLRDLRLETPTSKYVPPAVSQPVYCPAPPKEKKKCWLLRPLAWLVLLVSVYLMNIIISTGVLLGIRIATWLSELPTGTVVLLTLAFGSFTIGILFCGAVYLPSLIMAASHAIYPSKKGVRFYGIGAWQILISLTSVISVLTDPEATHVFWECASAIYFAIIYVFMMCGAKSVTDN